MTIETKIIDYSDKILRIKCSGDYGIGSEGNQSAEKVRKTIESWLKNNQVKTASLEIDYRDVHYEWGDGPISSIVPFLRVLKVNQKIRFIVNERNKNAISNLVNYCNLPFEIEITL